MSKIGTDQEGSSSKNRMQKGKKKIAGPFIGMVMAQFAQVGLMIASKAALSDGMNNSIFIVYSNAVASLVLLPSFLFYRSEKPPLTPWIVCGIFLLGLFSWLSQVFMFLGINLSSATLGATMLNLIPGLTFVLAVITRVEKFDWSSPSMLAKSIGTVVSIAGAFIVTCYKGPPVLRPSPVTLSPQIFSSQLNWVSGGLFFAANCTVASAWLTFQASVVKKYPMELVVVFIQFLLVTILSTILCLFIEREPTAWSLRPTTRLIAVLFSGVLGNAFQVGITTWCLRKTGPIFVAMFSPLGIVIAAVVGVICLSDALYLGSVIGAVVIAFGFYAVIWGKAREEKTTEDEENFIFDSSSTTVPFLQNKDVEEA